MLSIGVAVAACDIRGNPGFQTALTSYASVYEAWLAWMKLAQARHLEPVSASHTRPEHGDPALQRVITEASARFDVPEPWIRAVMQVESEGAAGVTSPKGAMGLMQVMPDTYRYLSDRHNLGENPYALRNNIFAGSAYLREMFDRYGSAGFLAAYNAGPGRYEDYVTCGRTLPHETTRYVGAVQLALGELLFSQANSRFYEPLSISPKGELLLSRTGKPLPIGDRLALHSLLARATQRAAAK
jgi:soluble lytic murein transglycosylase-like protein